MSVALIKILSCSIFIAEMQDKKILAILLKDYAKTRVNKSQFLFILMLAICYREYNTFRNHNFYKILSVYINLHANCICKSLLLY